MNHDYSFRYETNLTLHLITFLIVSFNLLMHPSINTGSIDHVSIRQLQLMLLKFALILGIDFVENVTFEEICPKTLTVSLSNETSSLSSSSRLTGKCNEIAECDEEEIHETDDTKCHWRKNTQERNESDSPDGNCLSSSTNSSDNNSSTRKNSNSRLNEKPGYDDNSDQDPLLSNSSRSRSSRSRSSLTISLSKDTKEQRISKFSCQCCCHLHSNNKVNQSSREASSFDGAFAHFSLTSSHISTPSVSNNHPGIPSATFVNDYPAMLSRLHSLPFHVVLGADGRRNTLADHFPRKEFRGRLAIAITANFVNKHTLTEAQIPEISGISFIYNQQLFK